jgi:MFS family permease
MPLYLVGELHYRESFYGMLFVINTAIIVAIEVPLNIGMAHWPARRTVPLAITLIAIGFGALAFARTPIPIAMTVVIWTFGEMILFPSGTAYVAELAPSGRTGEYMGAFSASLSLALIIGPWAGAFTLDRFGAVVTWVGAFVVGMIGAVLFLFARR